MYHLERVAQRAESYVCTRAYSSVEWHIEQAGQTLTAGLTGLADVNTGAALPTVPLYRIFSMTKPLVAAVAVMLIDEGKLRLSDAVEAHLPQFADRLVLLADGTLRPANTTLLVEHLFTHRSGITYQWQQGNPVAPLYFEKVKFADHHILADLVNSLAEQPLFADPGSTWHYSYSIDVLGHLIAVIEGKPLGDVLRERLFAPLGLTDTGFFVPESERARILPMFGDANLRPGMSKPQDNADGSLSYGAPYMTYAADNPDYTRGGLGLFSTVPDYTKAARFLLTGCTAEGQRLVSKAGISALWTNRLPESQIPIGIGVLPKYRGYGWGLGGRVMVKPGEAPFYSVAGECGWEGAATTYFWLDPVNDVTGVVMTQYLGQKFPLGEDLRAAFYQALE